MKKIGKIIVVLLLIMAGAWVVLRFSTPEDAWICKDSQWVKHGNPASPQPISGCGPAVEQTSEANPVVGGDRDAHGCIGSAGYAWCEAQNKCMRNWEEQCYSDSLQQVQYLLAQKYQKSMSEVKVQSQKQEGNYMQGIVNFAASTGEPEGGGMFWAAKKNNVWTVVWDGNGIMPCDVVSGYSFPKDMLPPPCQK